MRRVGSGNASPASLNESPSEKEGKLKVPALSAAAFTEPSMKVPPKRKGNMDVVEGEVEFCGPSMKVPPKRKGNRRRQHRLDENTAPQ